MHNPINRLLIVDGSSYLYRAYHAMMDLKNSHGLHTGALYGLVSMLRKLKEAYPSTYCACIFDDKEKTFRHDMYPQYKANRPPMPQALIEQLEHVDELVKGLGWLIIRIPKIEADDVIGTLAKYGQSYMQVLIATCDKDMAQLVNDKIHLIDTMKNTYMDIEGVKGKFNLEPRQIIDYLALMGDTSDNVPGIEKVGPKTAVKWLKEYDSLENIVTNAHKFSGVVGNNLRKDLSWLTMSKNLVTIKVDCEQEIEEFLPGWQSWRAFLHKDENILSLKDLFTKLEFKGWLKDIEKKETQHNNLLNTLSSTIDCADEDLNLMTFNDILIDVNNYKTITTIEQLKEWVQVLNNYTDIASLDTETTSLNALTAELVGISIAVRNNETKDEKITNTSVYIPIHINQQGLGIEALNILKPWLENEKFAKAGQNIKYDLHIFKQLGIEIKGLNDDTMLASYILSSHDSHNLDDLSRRYLNHQTTSYESVCGKGAKQITFDQVDINTATNYAAEDADITLHLHHILQQKLKKSHALFNVYKNLECNIAHVLLDMETAGILVDIEELKCQTLSLQNTILEIEKKAYAIAGKEFNLSSPKQVGEILFKELNLPIVKKTAGGTPSTDEEVLTKLSHDYPLPKLLLEHRTLSKLKTTYTDKLPAMVNEKTGRLHTNFAQAVAITGRLSSNDPNLQNIPIRTKEGRKIRQAFIAKSGSCLISADYSQIELRIMAHLSKDEGLIQAFSLGQDVHNATAKEIFNLSDIAEVNSEHRRFAKIINFGLIYGMSAFGAANNLGIDTKAAQGYIDTYFSRYRGVAQYMQQTKLDANENGYVETILGRRLYLPDIRSHIYLKRQASDRAAINAPMQGSAADIIKLAMISVNNYLKTNKLQTKILLQVHDELILEVPYEELPHIQSALPELMQNVYELCVPLIVNIGAGDTWEEAH